MQIREKERMFRVNGFTLTLFWDEVVNENLDKLNLRIHPIEDGQIVEIDTADELSMIDDAYK